MQAPPTPCVCTRWCPHDAVIPKGVAPFSLWTAANYTNYVKPRVVASALDSNTTYNGNLTFMPQFFS